MPPDVLSVLVFAAPDVTCAQGRPWSAVTAYVGARLRQRFGGQVTVEHVELFSARSFEFPDLLRAIEAGAPLPVVVVDGEIVSQGGKLSERAVAEAIERARDAKYLQEGPA